MKPTGTRLALWEAYRYSGLGCTFAAAVLLFMAGGWLLDGWLRVTPVFMVIGALFGAVLGSVSIYRRLLVEQDSDESGDRQ
jgi:F0F1-type ATP synthase assembly protein I